VNPFVAVSCLLAMLVLGANGLGWPRPRTASTGPQSQESTLPAKVSARLPFHLYQGYLIVVSGTIGPLRELKFLVDTGAYPSAVDFRIARALGLARRPGKVNLWDKTAATSLVVLPSLTVARVRGDSLPALAEDLSFLERATGHRVDAIVGLDVLRKSSFSINYQTKDILFGPVDDFSSYAPFDTELPVVTIRANLRRLDLRLVVDTGCGEFVLLRSRMPADIDLQLRGGQNAADMSGTFRPRREVQSPNILLGGELLRPQTAFVVDDRKDPGDDFDGVLGVKALRPSKIAFDFERRRFWWKR
jgi:Aspartyl protease